MKEKDAVFAEVFAPIEEEIIDVEKIDVDWFSPFDEDKFTILNCRNSKEKSFTRLSAEELKNIASVSPDVAFLGRHSAGIQLRFKTNSRIVKLRVTNYDNFEMKNMSFMGCSGFDSYARNNENEPFRYHSSAFPLFIDSRKWIGYPVTWYYQKDREYIINFPLYNGVFVLEVGIEKGCYLKASNRPNKKKILCYGTSILQGCSCSRPGINIANQVSRHFDQEVYNFGFSGAANLEKEVAEIIAKQDDLELLTIDCEANAGIGPLLVERLETFIQTIFEKQPKLPIILYNRDYSHHDEMSVRWPKIREYNTKHMQELQKKYSALGYEIYFFDKWGLFQDIEMTIEGLHPTDVGMNAISKFYIDTITQIKNKHE
jgi:hypothetical protein